MRPFQSNLAVRDDRAVEAQDLEVGEGCLGLEPRGVPAIIREIYQSPA